MIIGVPREIKSGEQRVALTPPGARALVEGRHRVVVERGAGLGSSIRDEEYTREGATLASVDEVWKQAGLILKVKEPLPEEYPRMRPGQILFTYLHLAPAPELARALQAAQVIAIAYETVQRPDGTLPLLAPMSEVAGRLSVQEGAFFLTKARGGRGILLAGVPGVPPGNIVVLGAGTVGVNAARIALGLGADVSILDINLDRLRAVDDLFHGRVITLVSNSFNISQVLRRADLLVGAVLVTGARAPVLVTKEMVASMKEGSVIVDVAVDQGGTVETIRPTTLLDPTYLVSGLRRGQHAGAGAAHVHLRAEQRDAALRARAGRQGPGRGRPRQRAAREGRQYLARADRAPGGGGSARGAGDGASDPTREELTPLSAMTTRNSLKPKPTSWVTPPLVGASSGLAHRR